LGLAKLGDVAGFNGDGAYLFFDPGLPNVVTEYGSIESQRPGNYDPRWGLLAYFSDPPIQYTWRPLHDELIKPFLVDNANLDKAERIGEAKQFVAYGGGRRSRRPASLPKNHGLQRSLRRRYTSGQGS
jgi:hypothetical protein